MRNCICICIGFSSPKKIFPTNLWLHFMASISVLRKGIAQQSAYQRCTESRSISQCLDCFWKIGWFFLSPSSPNRYTESTHLCLHTRKREIAFTSSVFFLMKKKRPKPSKCSEAHMNFLFDAVRFYPSGAKRVEEKIEPTKYFNKTHRAHFSGETETEWTKISFWIWSHQMQIKANRKAICQNIGGFSCRIWYFFFFFSSVASVVLFCRLFSVWRDI